MQKRTGLLAVIAGNTIFGFSFLFSKLALDIASPSILIATRFTVAFLILNLVILIGKNIRRSDGTPLVQFTLRNKPLLPVLLLSLCQPIIYFEAESYGIIYTSSSFSGMMIALIPLAGILADVLFEHAKFSGKALLCAIGSVAGVILASAGSSDLHSSAIGIVMLLVAVAAGAMFYVLSRRAGEYYNALERTYVMFASACIFFLVLALIQNGSHLLSALTFVYTQPVFWLSIAYLSVLSSVGAFLLLNYGSSLVSVSQASLMANLTTVISIAAGVLILHESFSIFQILGSILILVSVYTATSHS